MQNGLKKVSGGIVVKDKDRFTDEIDVYPYDELYDIQPGNVREGKREFIGSKESPDSGSFQTRHESKNYVRAKWKNVVGDNRVSAPDVRQGETVDLYQYPDTENYFWSSVGREPGLRGREDVTVAFSNKEGGGRDSEFDLSSSYYSRWNTLDGFVLIHTATNNNEKSGYDILINGKAGTLSIRDTHEQFIHMDSPEGILHVSMKKQIFMEAEEIKFKSERHIVETEIYHTTATTKADFTTPKGMFSEILDVNQMVRTPVVTNLAGDAGGTMTVSGSMNLKGHQTVQGTQTVEQDLTVNGTLHAKGGATGSFPR